MKSRSGRRDPNLDRMGSYDPAIGTSIDARTAIRKPHIGEKMMLQTRWHIF